MTRIARPSPEEPAAGPWELAEMAEVVRRVRQVADVTGRPLVIAVDGRSAAGKSTFAARLHEAIPGSVLLYGDDLSWHEPLFAWEHLLREGVLLPMHRGEAVAFVPPAWAARRRDGAVVVVASDVPAVVIEGVGVSQRAVADLVDVPIWVQSDAALAEERGLARDIADGGNGDADESLAFWRWWMDAEQRFLAADRPWERAAFVVAGNLRLAVPDGAVALTAGPLV